MPDMESFIRSCAEAREGSNPTAEIADLMRDLIADPGAVEAGVEKHRIAKLANGSVLYRSPDLTILDLHQPPGFYGMPHDHLMWVVSGVYRGREDTNLYRRAGDRIEATGKSLKLVAPAVCILPSDAVHDVSNPLTVECANLQVCGGDFLAATPGRTAWEIETGEPLPFAQYMQRRFGAKADAP